MEILLGSALVFVYSAGTVSRVGRGNYVAVAVSTVSLLFPLGTDRVHADCSGVAKQSASVLLAV